MLEYNSMVYYGRRHLNNILVESNQSNAEAFH